MRNNRLSLFIVGFVIATFVLSLSSCSNEPFVSRAETVEVYNSSINVANAVVYDELGYEKRYEDHYASTYYKYVLFDGNVKCPVIKSVSSEFKTESNNQNGPIHKDDVCIDCGYTWKEHVKR